MTISPKSIGPNTQLCAIIGNPVSHSMSPAMHNRAFQELGLDFVYLAFRVESVGDALAGMRSLENFRGLSVTIPHKTAVVPYLDTVAEVDAVVGSVNTIVSENGRLHGLGTDGPGARKALHDRGVDLNRKQILILGSGGAARALAFDLAFNTKPSGITLMGIIPEELRQLESDVRAAGDIPVTSALITEASLAEQVARAEIMIHTTPVGMHPHEDDSIIPKALLHDRLAVMDIVYNPLTTKLLREAREKGLQAISGLDMFVNQAALQFEAWTGLTAPVEVMRRVVLDHLG